eukprot:TRINITY_DN6975_c2_g1_i2.p1 TRINITY_DN6975_c2_g1~~TRINITY_DN6975_c2_g1_i2.p1  ORF type:complete len:782 (+),score=321.41 TRINITY_DN6975_c2_g1_i2:2078-4423(+)
MSGGGGVFIQTETISRPRPSLKTRPVDFHRSWESLRDAMAKVLTDPLKPPEVGINTHYHTVYQLCTSQCVNLHGSIGDVPLASESQEGKAQPWLLYQRLKAFLIDFIDTKAWGVVGQSRPQTDILVCYLEQWKNFKMGMDFIHSAFHFMNQWVRSSQERPGDIFEVRTLGYICWKEHLYMKFKTSIIKALLELIQADRMGEVVDHSLLKGVIQSIVALGVDLRIPTQFYSEQFEARFIRATEEFYAKEVAEKLGAGADQTLVLPDYMIHSEKRLEEEHRRLQQYLDKSTEKELMKTLIKVMIDAHINTLLEASQEWFDDDRIPEQKRLFRLLEKSDGGLEPLRKLIEDRIDAEGKATILKVKTEALKDPCVYVEMILQVYKKYAVMVKEIFQDHEHFKAALEKGCKRFINKNAIATTSGAKSADLLAKYAHMLLKPSSKVAKTRTEEELDETLGEVLTIFSLLEDIDVFQRVYRDKLSQRLIHNTYSQEHETIMIGKLKSVCGYEYTYKLQRMFTDMGTSRDMNKEFLDAMGHMEAIRDGPAMTVNVLTSVSWPQTAPKYNFAVPPVIQSCLDCFTEFYKQKHQGRSLSWLHTQSNGILKTTYTASKTYELQVSTQQATILLAFNDVAVSGISWDEMLNTTRMQDKELEFGLSVLTKFKLLNNDNPADMKKAKFSINEAFQAMNRKVLLYNAQHKEGQQTDDVIAIKAVAEDRKYSIQAAIVRLMKSRKTMSHTTLVTDVIAQLQGTFKPTNTDVKKNIENLIEKDYLERTPDGKSYKYLA